MANYFGSFSTFCIVVKSRKSRSFLFYLLLYLPGIIVSYLQLTTNLIALNPAEKSWGWVMVYSYGTVYNVVVSYWVIYWVITCRLGNNTGIYYVDSAKLTVCHNLRIHSHKVFDELSKRRETSTGWFFSLKLHLITNQFGEIVSFFITPVNVADNNLELGVKLRKGLCGKHFGDKGYISEKISKELARQELFLVTKIKKNMKNKMMLLHDKVWLKGQGGGN